MTPGIRCTCLSATGGPAVPDPSAGVTARLVGGPYSGVVVVLEHGSTRYRIGQQGWEPCICLHPAVTHAPDCPLHEPKAAGEYVFVGVVEYGYSRFDWVPACTEPECGYDLHAPGRCEPDTER